MECQAKSGDSALLCQKVPDGASVAADSDCSES